jgi:nitroreductase
MDLFDAIARRASYRGPFAARPVPREHLKIIVQAGLQAPSACNEQTPAFGMDPIQSPSLRSNGEILEKGLKWNQTPLLWKCITERWLFVERFNPRIVQNELGLDVALKGRNLAKLIRLDHTNSVAHPQNGCNISGQNTCSQRKFALDPRMKNLSQFAKRFPDHELHTHFNPQTPLSRSNFFEIARRTLKLSKDHQDTPDSPDSHGSHGSCN